MKKFVSGPEEANSTSQSPKGGKKKGNSKVSVDAALSAIKSASMTKEEKELASLVSDPQVLAILNAEPEEGEVNQFGVLVKEVSSAKEVLAKTEAEAKAEADNLLLLQKSNKVVSNYRAQLNSVEDKILDTEEVVEAKRLAKEAEAKAYADNMVAVAKDLSVSQADRLEAKRTTRKAGKPTSSTPSIYSTGLSPEETEKARQAYAARLEDIKNLKAELAAAKNDYDALLAHAKKNEGVYVGQIAKLEVAIKTLKQEIATLSSKPTTPSTPEKPKVVETTKPTSKDIPDVDEDVEAEPEGTTIVLTPETVVEPPKVEATPEPTVKVPTAEETEKKRRGTRTPPPIV